MPDGSTKLDNLRAASRRVHVPELNYPLPDSDAEYLLEHFYSLKARVGDRISYTEIKSYSELMALNLQPFEVEAITGVDRIFDRSIGG